MVKSFKSHLLRFWNLWPPFLFSGIKIVHQSKDYRYFLVKLKLRFWNANYLGTQFGGGMCMMTDPFYMIMLIKNLGPEYIVWDKIAIISYLKPGTTDLTAEFIIDQDDIDEIIDLLQKVDKIDWLRVVEIKNKENAVVATVSKTIYIKRKR